MEDRTADWIPKTGCTTAETLEANAGFKRDVRKRGGSSGKLAILTT